MALDHVLDDGQSQPGAAGIARAAAVDAIEALREPRQVLARDAGAVVDHRDLAAMVRRPAPLQLDAPAFRRVAHRVADQVGDRAEDFGLDARQLDASLALAHQFMPPVGQRLRVGADARQQRIQRDPVISGRPRAALELRQRQQVADQRLHPRRLLLHQVQHALALGFGQLQAGHGFDEAGQHRQRRADLVRHVGDEITPHRLVALAVRHIQRQHQLARLPADAVVAHQHLQRGFRAGVGQRQRLLEVAVLQVGDEGRIPDQVGDPLQLVALRVQREMVAGDDVAPLDVVLAVEQDHAIGGSLDRQQELLELLALAVVAALPVAQAAFDAVGHLAPQAAKPGRVVVLVAAQPGHQPMRPRRVPDGHQDDGRRRGQRRRQLRHPHPFPQPVAQSPRHAGAQHQHQHPRQHPCHGRVLRPTGRCSAGSDGSRRRAPFRSCGRS